MAKEIHKRISVWLNQQGIENNLKSVRAAINKTANELAKLPIGTEEWYRKSEKLKKLKDIQVELQKEIKTTSAEIEKHNRKLNNTIVNIGAIASAYTGASTAIRRILSTTQEYVEAYASLDDAMTSVSKYTGLAREEVKQLNEEFQRMNTRTPIEKLNALAADAGRLGITSKEAIKDFVEAADIINVALGEDLGEDAVKNIGKMAQMFGESETMGLRGAMIATASAVNTLAQSSSASEPYIMDFSARLAGVANTAGVTQAQIMGIASAMDQNMAQVERSATAVQKVMMDMMGKTEKYANLVGMTAEEFRKLVDSDMNTALLTVLDKLKEIRDTGGKSAFAETLDELKLKGAGVQDTLMMLAEKTNQLREAQQLATQAYADGNSVINEAAAVNGNAAAQIEKMNNQIKVQKAKLGEELYPIYQKIISSTLSLASGTVSLVKYLKAHAEILVFIGILFSKRIAQFVVLTAKQIAHTAAKVKDIVVTKAQAVATNLSTIKLAAECIYHDLAAKKIRLHTAAQEMLMVVMKKTPWGLVLASIAAIASALISWTKRTRDAKKELAAINKEIGDKSNGSITLFEKLRQQYSQLGNSMKDKEKFIKDNKSAFEELGVSVQSVVDAENLFIANKDNFVNSLLARAKAAAYQSKAQEIMSKNIERTEPLQQKIDEYNKKIEKIRDQLPEITPDTDPSTLDAGLYQELNSYYSMIGTLQRQIDSINQEAVGYIKRQIEIENEADRLFSEGGFTSFSYSANGSGPGSGDSPDKKTLTDRENFQKKLQQMQDNAQSKSLEGWEKTKHEILNKYKELETEAEKLYGKNSEAFKKVQELKVQELSGTLGKYLKTLSDASDKMMEEAKKMLDESNPDNKETPLIKAVFGEQQKWNEKINAAKQNIKTLDDIIDRMNPEDDGWDSLHDNRQKFYEQLLQLQEDNAAAISNVVRQHTQSDSDFIKDQEEKLARARMSDHDRQVAEINELYNTKIEAKKKEIAALEELLKKNPENADIAKQIEELKELIEQLEKLQDQEIAAVPKSGGPKSVWQQLAEFDWSKMSKNWQSALNLMAQGLQEFANAAFDIYGSIAQIQDNMMEAELQKTRETYDAKSAALQRQLNDGVISQKAYDAKMQKLNEEKEKKERKLKHEQFAREKTASIIQATISGIVAIMQGFSQAGPIVGAVLAAVQAAITAAQIAAIASQPNPYVKGGYIRGRQYAVMGEQGDEWVASNRLLRDRETADIIAALDEYQRGDHKALAGISIPQPDLKNVSQAVRAGSGTFAPSNQTTTNNYYQNDNGELLKELRQMNEYLRDPNNRRAYISRKIQLEFDEQEREVRELARL